MNHDTEHQLRELIRNVIREELKSREVKKDAETGITTSDLEDKEGKKVGYMKHKELPTGGFVAGGRIGPKAAEKNDEAVVFAPSVDLKAAIEKLRQTPTHKTKTSQHARVIEIPKDAKKDSDKLKEAEYNKDAVDKAIASSKEKVGGAEAKAIHRLLKGRHGKGSKKNQSVEDRARELGQIEMFEEKLRETSTYKLKTNQMEARLTPDDAKGILDKHDAHDDFHALKSDKVSALLGAAKDAKYRRRSDAPGSKARMFHQHLTRLAGKKK